MSFKWVFFDLDGTLTDSSEGIEKSAAGALDAFGIAYDSLDDLSVFIGPPLRAMFPKWGVPEDKTDEAIRIFRRRYNTVGKFENHPYPGIAEMLGHLKDAGLKLAVATSKPEPMAKEILKHFHLDGYFDVIAGATYDKSRESKEAILRYLLDMCSAEDAVLVGDTVYDTEGAEAVGIASIGAAWGFGSTDEMKEKGALRIVRTPGELETYLLQKS